MTTRPRTAVAIALPVAALAALGGLAAGRGLTPSSGGASTAQSSTAGATVPGAASATAAPATRAPSTAAPATASAQAPTRSTVTTTVAPRPTTAPATVRPWVSDPWNKGYEFGFVWGAKRSGDAVLLTFDRAGMLLGEQAKAYYDAHPDEERFDYKVLNDKSFTETVRVPASATLYGNQVLGPRNGSQIQRITQDRVLARASGDGQRAVAVWLKRTGSGPVVYLAEQYLP